MNTPVWVAAAVAAFGTVQWLQVLQRQWTLIWQCPPSCEMCWPNERRKAPPLR